MLVPKELEKIEEQLSNLQNEKEKMEELKLIIEEDLLIDLSD